MQLDYMVLADYVRQDGGVLHILGAGIDTIAVVRVPHVQPLGIALRISFDAGDPVGEQHQVKVTFMAADQIILIAQATFARPAPPEGIPVHWRTGAGVALQIPVLLPSEGDYTCEVVIDEAAVVEPKSTDFRVITRPAE